jgi:hypothetical protein
MSKKDTETRAIKGREGAMNAVIKDGVRQTM